MGYFFALPFRLSIVAVANSDEQRERTILVIDCSKFPYGFRMFVAVDPFFFNYPYIPALSIVQNPQSQRWEINSSVETFFSAPLGVFVSLKWERKERKVTMSSLCAALDLHA